MYGGMWWHIWFRHCGTNQKVKGSIPDGVIGIFHWHNPSVHTTALGLTQPLTEMSTRNISWGVKATSMKGWQPCHLNVLKFGCLNPQGLSSPVMGLLYLKVNVCVNVVMKVAVTATTSQIATSNVTVKNAGIQKSRKVILHSNYF